MLAVFIINTILGFIMFAVSAIIASVIFQTLLPSSEPLRFYFFMPVLLLSVGCFFLFFIFLAIYACRMVVLNVHNKTGIFPNTSKSILLRVTSDVLTCHLCEPLYQSLPFLINMMGAKTGKNFIFAGKIFNADLLKAGDNVVVGEEAFLCCHLQQKDKIILDKITIGNNVTIGVRSFIMPGVEIGENSILAAYSVVPIGTRIPPNEIWGGTPVKKISDRED